MSFSKKVNMIQIMPAKKPTTLEKTRQRNILRFLNALPNCVAEARTQTGYNIKGGADILGCINGRHFEFEVKQPGKQLTPLQKKWLQDWEICGAIVGRVEDVEAVIKIFRSNGVI